MANNRFIELRGFRIFKGGSFRIYARVSIEYEHEQLLLQLQNAFHSLKAIKVAELEWVIEQGDFRVLQDKLHYWPDFLEASSGPTLYTRPIRWRKQTHRGRLDG